MYRDRFNPNQLLNFSPKVLLQLLGKGLLFFVEDAKLMEPNPIDAGGYLCLQTMRI
jgi:hypothetical protein